jgi:hypothetical protein
MSFSVRFWFLNELAVYSMLILLLKSPSEMSTNVSNTDYELTFTFSFSQISFSLLIYASLAMGENLNLTHLEASGSMILLM